MPYGREKGSTGSWSLWRSVYYCTVIVRGHEGQSDNVYTDHCNSDADQSGRYPDRGIG